MTEGLSISIDNAHDQVRGGDGLAYRITVRNTGSSDVEDLRITQSIPPGVRVVSAGQGGDTSATAVRWTTTVPAGGDVAFTDEVVFDAAPEGTVRLASSACAYRTGETRPVVCSTDSDQLAVSPAALATSPVAWWPPAVVLVLLVAVAGAFVVVRKRRRARPAA